MNPRPEPAPDPDPDLPADNVVDLEARRAGWLFKRGMNGDVQACIEWLDRYHFGNKLPRRPWDDVED